MLDFCGGYVERGGEGGGGLRSVVSFIYLYVADIHSSPSCPSIST